MERRHVKIVANGQNAIPNPIQNPSPNANGSQQWNDSRDDVVSSF